MIRKSRINVGGTNSTNKNTVAILWRLSKMTEKSTSTTFCFRLQQGNSETIVHKISYILEHFKITTLKATKRKQFKSLQSGLIIKFSPDITWITIMQSSRKKKWNWVPDSIVLYRRDSADQNTRRRPWNSVVQETKASMQF